MPPFFASVAEISRDGLTEPPRRGQTRIAETVARNLYKLMACKDEYEVARLLLRGGAEEEIRRQFPGGARVYWHLHPPFLRALGIKRKLRLGRWRGPRSRCCARSAGCAERRSTPSGRRRCAGSSAR